MKTTGILYASSEKKHFSDTFLSKDKLKKLFPNDEYVIMSITFVRKSYRIAERRKGKYVIRKNYPKTSTKSRRVLL